MRNTRIEWADLTWNPFTGCLHGCLYCYARRIANRFASKDPEAILETANSKDIHILQQPYVYNGTIEPYPYGFQPTFHMYRLHDLEKVRESSVVFVCSMSDLFGAWVPDWIISSVMEACRRAPQHTYMFLTKNPYRYDDLIDEKIIKPTDTNFWLGTTITDLSRIAHWNKDHHTFWSVEPILAPWPKAVNTGFRDLFPDWIILGAETGNRADKVVPEKSWIDNIVLKCRMMEVPVLMKESLVPIVGEDNMIREFPEELQ